MAQLRTKTAQMPVRDALRLTAMACMVGAGLAIIGIWSGLPEGPLERALPIVALMLGLWANILSGVLLMGWLRR